MATAIKAAGGEGLIDIVPSGGALGAEVRGLDLAKPLSPPVVAALRAAWLEHLALLFRDQSLNDEQLIAFGRQFGELHVTKGLTYGGKPEGTPPELELISTLREDGVPADAKAADECIWHTDMSFFEIPASAGVLYAQIVPPTGGNTSFTNLYRAYETLPEALRQAVEGRTSLHDAAYTAMHEIRAGYAPVVDKSQGPGFRHPIVRTHAETARKCLYLGRHGYGYIDGYSVSESDRLLAELWAHMTQPRFVWEHAWRPGDVVMWDNRCTAHSREAIHPSVRRRLRRITVKGERPV